MKLKIRKLLKYWMLASFLLGAVVFLYGLVFLSAGCRECPVLSFILGLMLGGGSLLANLGFFLLLIPVNNYWLRFSLSVLICLLPVLNWKFLLFKNKWMNPPDEFITPVLITALLSGCYIFIRTFWAKKTTTS